MASARETATRMAAPFWLGVDARGASAWPCDSTRSRTTASLGAVDEQSRLFRLLPAGPASSRPLAHAGGAPQRDRSRAVWLDHHTKGRQRGETPPHPSAAARGLPTIPSAARTTRSRSGGSCSPACLRLHLGGAIPRSARAAPTSFRRRELAAAPGPALRCPTRRGCLMNAGARLDPRVGEPNLAVRSAVGLLRAYKRWLSPLLPRSCRFSPTCSEYARLAILKHGLLRGLWLTMGRLLRCQPFAAGGIDCP